MTPPVHSPATGRRASHWRWRVRQRGLSLVELALGLAVLGVLAGLAFKSQELMEQYQQAQFVNKVQSLKAQISAYRSSLGRWPGDCNRDGLMDSVFISPAGLTTTSFDYALSTPLTPATSSTDPYAVGLLCPASTLTPFDDANVAYNELKYAGLLRTGEPNRKAASHGLGGFMHLGTFDTGAGSTTTLEQQFNALVLTNVPIAAARRLAVAMDGFDGSASNVNQVRRSDDLQTFAPLWTAAGETELTRITVAVFFDRVPPVPAN